MKIATYNIWNSTRGMPKREDHIINEINELDSDVIALQEVKDKSFADNIFKYTLYDYYCFTPHEGDNEGLAVYSKYPIKSYTYSNNALIVTIEHMNNIILLVNVHLPWNSVLVKEENIVNINKEIATIPSDFQFIVGDFNCDESSSVHQYLLGNRSLKGTEVKSYWTDLAAVASEFFGIEKAVTLDIVNNPRWKGKIITDISARVDCIFIHDCFPNPYPTLNTFQLFGKNVHEETGLCPSDHYGIIINLTMPYEEL